jgi:hypothetical protein
MAGVQTAIPNITQGLNLFTPNVWRQMKDSIEWVQRHRQFLESHRWQYERRRQAVAQNFAALVMGYESISDPTQNRYKYSWQEAIWDDSAALYVARSGGRHSGDGDDWDASADKFSSPAYNGLETANLISGCVSAGVDIGGPAYEAVNFYMQPIRANDWAAPPADPDPGTAQVTWAAFQAPAVRIFNDVGDEGNDVWVFYVSNVHDGCCETDCSA